MAKTKKTQIKKRTESWNTESMEAALKAVERNKLSQRAICEKYGIPRRTLRNHMKSGTPLKRLGRKSILTIEQEKDLSQRILRMADIGLPITLKMLKYQVYKFCTLHQIPHTFNTIACTAGRSWLTAFLKRNPKISRRKAQFMNQARAQKLNKFIVKDHFEKLNNLLTELDIKFKPERIFNMDEKGCRLTMHHQPTVLAQKGAKRVHFIANEHAENVTVVGCVSAIGNVIPPMIIFKGKRGKPEFTDNLPPGSIISMAPKGFITTELFIKFLNHFASFKLAGKILLVFDGAASHLDYTIVEAADKHDIVLYCLPSNTTHELQPLDKSVYRSFEHHWDQEFLKYQDKHPDRKFNKTSFNIVFSEVWSKCMTQSNITNGFRSVGLYPFDPEAIPDSAFAPLVLTERPTIENQTPNIAVNSLIVSDDIPLAELLNKNKENQSTVSKTPFQKLITTPKRKDFSAGNSQRKKALNYKAQKVTKDLFKKQYDKKSDRLSTSKAITHSTPTVTWYCTACKEDRMEDMRQCTNNKCNIMVPRVICGTYTTRYRFSMLLIF
ncbi:PREDICTED: tigger transposable element-derived protein 1-like [Trachymyrmex cornetzi]|uniref:tigger transposable element-derived protein 1-like n=1 Tax=Trachymyrmex cornetzi TaxID=471704 RepID=UPI00084F3D04|nr:PREDICTED: tigger transposable element-derived protein 1-like [Trachymyrmex cornetzi]